MFFAGVDCGALGGSVSSCVAVSRRALGAREPDVGRVQGSAFGVLALQRAVLPSFVIKLLSFF